MNKKKEAIIGAIIGDALGVPFEFKERSTFEAVDMVGYGTYNQPEGTWSDDSSLMLCILDSLGSLQGWDEKDIKARFKRWMSDAYMTPHGEVFDIGITTESALYDLPTFDKNSERANGNGGLMRTLPLGLYFGGDYNVLKEVTFKTSAITHGHIRSKLCCYFYCILVHKMLKMSFKDAYNETVQVFKDENLLEGKEVQEFSRILNGSILEASENEIESDGYVRHTLEASLWCMAKSSSFNEAVLMAVNLGEDTDTTACVVGGLAGLEWGVNEEWMNILVKIDEIHDIIDNVG